MGGMYKRSGRKGEGGSRAVANCVKSVGLTPFSEMVDLG